MPAIVTTKHRLINSDYYEQSLVNVPTYVVIGQTSEWDDESEPPEIKDSTLDNYGAFTEVAGAKRILSTSIVSVLRRIDWAYGETYDEYDDSVDLINEQNPDTDNYYDFYVFTDEFNVYKCISNNNRSPSTTKPSGTSVSSFQTPDGYIWKYMYTVKTTEAFDYVTQNWLPCHTLTVNDLSSQWLVQAAAIDGTIEHVVVTDNGTGYISSNPPTITITGDGSGATATPVIDDDEGTLTNIIITNKGSGYTTATVTVNASGDGVGATARAVLSPVGGHGKDARAELGAIYKMVKIDFEDDEDGDISTAISFRRVAIVSEPLHDTDTGTVLYVSNTDKFFVGEEVTGDTSSASGTVYAINATKGKVFLSAVTGDFSPSEDVTTESGFTVSLLSADVDVSLPLITSVVAPTDFMQNSGDLLYFATREYMTRGAGQKETVRLVIAF